MTKQALYTTELWAELVSLQNKDTTQDIITITGFMDVQETIEYIKNKLNK